MNPKLKLALILSRSHSREQGAVLPIIIGIGLIMTIAGTTMIIRSSDEQTTAVAQNQTAQALGAAEAGITRIQNILNQNRYLAQVNSDDWDDLDTADPTVTGICTGSASITEAIALAGDGPQPIDEDDPDKGKFELIEYEYTPVGGLSANPPVGTVIGNGELAIAGYIGNNSKSQIVVNIPIVQSDPNQIPIPGLFVSETNSGAQGLGNTFETDVLYSGGCEASASAIGGTVNPGKTIIFAETGKEVPVAGKRTPMPALAFPPLPSKPAIPADQQLGNITQSTPSPITLPRPGDDFVDSDGFIAYAVDGISWNGGNRKIEITPGAKVRFYLDGDINLAGNAGIVHDCPKTVNNVNNTVTYASGCSPTDFQVFGYSSNGSVCIRGGTEMGMFFFGPNYDVGINGGGSGNAFTGTVWARGWRTGTSCTSTTGSVVAVTQAATWDQLGESFVPVNLPPTLSAISEWKRE